MQNSPFFIWSIYFLLGCSFALHPHLAYSIPLLALLIFSNRRVQGILFCLAGVALTLFRYPSLPLPEAELVGEGVFSLETIQPMQTPFHKSIAFKGKFKSFESGGNHYTNIPCILFPSPAPKKGSQWHIEGTLRPDLVFKPKKGALWKELEGGFSLARYRFQQKEKLRRFFHAKVADKRVAHFFASMATGDIDDWLLAMEFRKLGLGHILAISGFHFALLAMLVGGMLRSVLPPKIAYIILLLFLTFYFLFLGGSASIFRAFVMIGLYVLGLILKRPIDGLNLLGVALLSELLVEPLFLEQIGFQLSFLATLGIILFYRPCHSLLERLLPQRTFSEVRSLPLLDQHGALFTSALRAGIALNLAVLLITLPAVLFIFRSFSLLSLPYNLLFPLLLGISLMLLPLGILFPPLLTLNAHYTSYLLHLIANPPEILNYKFFIPTFPLPLLLLIITVIGIWGLTKRGQTSKNIPK